MRVGRTEGEGVLECPPGVPGWLDTSKLCDSVVGALPELDR